MKPLPTQLPELTSIRAIAAFIVVSFHMFFNEANPPGFWNNLIANGHLGVDLFFMLSGFILAHVYLQPWRQGRYSAKEFLVNRFARIYPLHFFMIALFLCAYQAMILLEIGSAAEGQNWAHLPWHVLLLHAWGVTDSHSWNFPSWSVSAEAFAYIVFPVIIWIATKFRPWKGLIIALTVFIIGSVFSLVTFDKQITKLMYDFGILRVITEFYIGVSIYLILEKHRLPEALIQPVFWFSAFIIIAGAWLQVDERVIVLGMALLLVSLAHLATLAHGSVLRHPALVYLGEISYATYMAHLLVMDAVRALSQKLGFNDPLWVSILTVLLIYTFSVILYHVIERPGRKLIRTAFHSRKTAGLSGEPQLSEAQSGKRSRQ